MGTIDVGQYCRDVEGHLTRANEGHLVRIVGTGFELVRQWAEAGIPLSVVCRAIDFKVDRHRQGHARRPLRIEFCEADVRELYDAWRRAVGVPRGDSGESTTDSASEAQKRPSLTKQLDRVISRLSQVISRLDLPEAFSTTVGDILQEVVVLRDSAKGVRGQARDELAVGLDDLDDRLMTAARAAAPPDLLEALARDAAQDLSQFRQRLDDNAWRQAVQVTVDRLLRDRFGLPTMR